jgi:6-phosphogluconate dehydrogenase
MATETPMQLGMVGLGRMGANLVRRLMRDGHQCVGTDVSAETVAALGTEGMTGATGAEELVTALEPPRAVWVMVPAGEITERAISELAELLAPGDTVIDGGNTRYHDDIRRAKELSERGLHYVDCGTSGGVFGLERGFCLMIGGEDDVVARLAPIFTSLAPGLGTIERTPGRSGEPSPEELGWLHCGPAGAGHFVKMVHNGIEYGLMAAYAEGLNVLHHASVGLVARDADAETAPLENPELYRYDLDIAAVAEVWRRGSVVASWLLDLAAAALRDSPALDEFAGRVSDSGEGRWTSIAAIDTGTPAPVLTAALYDRFSSRGEGDFAHRLLSAMRHQFGGHAEKQAG